MAIAIIPARSGSKRIPRKNIKEFAGKPMIAHSIEAAQESGCFTRIIVSTDSREIADIAIRYGAEAPFIRPESLSDDHTGTVPVLLHAIDWLNENEIGADSVCCIYATAPFIQPERLRKAYKKLKTFNPTSVFSVTSFAFPIFRGLLLDDNGRPAMIWPENRDKRSQDLPDAYHDAGQFYWLNVSKFLIQKSLYAEDSLAEVLSRRYVQDIDTQEDWDTAAALYKALKFEEIGN